MKQNNFFSIFILLFSSFQFALAQSTEKTAEISFQMAMKTILDKYVDKKITREQLYHAATTGMLKSLNANGEDWNEILTPDELKEMEIDLTGKVVGIGVAMEYNDDTGTAKVLNVIPNSAAESSGIKADDLILTVNNQSFKGKPFQSLVSAIRGVEGQKVQIKVLRETEVIKFDIKRRTIAWTPVRHEILNNSTAILHIGLFNSETPTLVKRSLQELSNKRIKKLIIDLRGNPGGAFQQMLETAGFFLPSDAIIAISKDRDGQKLEYRAQNRILDPMTKMIVLVNKETSSGAELFTTALHDYNQAKIIGEKTKGKWNAQMVEKLPDNYAMKFTVKNFETAKGQTFQGIGLTPEIEIKGSETDQIENARLKTTLPMAKRLSMDTQLKAGLEYIQTL